MFRERASRRLARYFLLGATYCVGKVQYAMQGCGAGAARGLRVSTTRPGVARAQDGAAVLAPDCVQRPAAPGLRGARARPGPQNRKHKAGPKSKTINVY